MGIVKSTLDEFDERQPELVKGAYPSSLLFIAPLIILTVRNVVHAGKNHCFPRQSVRYFHHTRALRTCVRPLDCQSTLTELVHSGR